MPDVQTENSANVQSYSSYFHMDLGEHFLQLNQNNSTETIRICGCIACVPPENPPHFCRQQILFAFQSLRPLLALFASWLCCEVARTNCSCCSCFASEVGRWTVDINFLSGRPFAQGPLGSG